MNDGWPMDVKHLLDMPWSLQVAIAGGYAAYLIGNMGLRKHRKTVDVAFATFLFSLFATALYVLARQLMSDALLAGLAAFAGAAVLGAVWRRWGRGLYFRTASALGVSQADDADSALDDMFGQTGFAVSQVAVELEDGRQLMCDNTSQFADAPITAFTMGASGDVLMYVTTIKTTDGEVREQTSCRDADYGDRITYIPAQRIKRMMIRHVPKRSIVSR